MTAVFPFFRKKPNKTGDGIRQLGRDTFSFQFHITDACDQRCRHCYIYGDDGTKAPLTMPWDKLLEAVALCETFCEGMGMRPFFFLTGGDPLLHPDFWRLAEHLHRRKHSFAILGNPFHLTKTVCRRLKKLGCLRYQLSLDGLEETHDLLRKPGSYKETMEKIGMLKKSGLKTTVMTTVSSLNIDQIPALVDEVVAAGADHYAFARYCPSAKDGTNGLTPERYRELLYTCGKKFHELIEAGCQTSFGKKDHLWVLYDYENGRFTPPEDALPNVIYGGCHCGTQHLTLLPNGDVMACRRVPDSVLGNLFTHSLEQLWAGQLSQYRQLERFEKCSGCELLSWCRGCPAVAKCTNGSFYSPDPQCWKE
ncbi:MAG: radical SAM/SPASM domain protein, ACGX system [Clostridia bacterium]|nr:radical SAM/SPASM domain protein, ACGX system [Clostridia bacterium]